VLLASVPRRGAIPATLRLARREPLTVLRVLTTISMWPIVRSEARARRAFFSPGAPQEIVEATFQRLQNESFRSFVNMLVRPPRPSRVRTPVHVIAAELDWFLTHGEQRDLAEAYESELKIIAGGHDLMLDRSWTEAADEVLRWAASLDRAPPEP
jgi:pimeloyl-ACP methyl ester carboxylesterase